MHEFQVYWNLIEVARYSHTYHFRGRLDKSIYSYFDSYGITVILFDFVLNLFHFLMWLSGGKKTFFCLKIT